MNNELYGGLYSQMISGESFEVPERSIFLILMGWNGERFLFAAV